jgi:hypothetical protein
MLFDKNDPVRPFQASAIRGAAIVMLYADPLDLVRVALPINAHVQALEDLTVGEATSILRYVLDDVQHGHERRELITRMRISKGR